MKILVYGAGAVGSTIGGMLADAGHSVTLVGRDPHMKRIAASGLKITGLWGTHEIKTLQALTEIPPDASPDWILLTTKAYDTAAAAQTLAQRFPKEIPVLHLQNGIGNAELLIARLGAARVLSGMIIIGFQIPMAGRAVVTVSADKIRIGRIAGGIDDTVKAIVGAFNAAQMPAEAVSDVQSQLWGKVLYNASLNALAGILGVKYGDLLDAEPWSLIVHILDEAFAALKAENVKLPWETQEAYQEQLRKVQIPATFDHRPSMLADLHHGRRTEIDFINGALVALGRKHQLSMPVNETIIAMVHALEENGKKGILHPSLQPTDGGVG
jgi:2-dehydropantoate 2-reductase